MDSILIYQAANDLVQNTGTRNIKRIARSCSLDILETPRFKDVLGFLSLHYDKPLILIRLLPCISQFSIIAAKLPHRIQSQGSLTIHLTQNKVI